MAANIFWGFGSGTTNISATCGLLVWASTLQRVDDRHAETPSFEAEKVAKFLPTPWIDRSSSGAFFIAWRVGGMWRVYSLSVYVWNWRCKQHEQPVKLAGARGRERVDLSFFLFSFSALESLWKASFSLFHQQLKA